MKNCNVLKLFIDYMSEGIDFNNIKKIESVFVHKKNKDYVLISNIHEIPEKFITDEAITGVNHKYLYAMALPKYDCLFCFDHELDHLPFIMAIELIRQAGIAIGHTIHGYPVSGFSNIMDNINLNIIKFIELDVPIIMIIHDVVLKRKPNRQERIMHFHLYQNKTLCASIDVNASIMEIDIYKRLRLNSRAELVKNTSLEKTPITNVQMLKNAEPTLVN